jgi:ubiquinone/menaquinone biosynthesis C-methylase UbiE
VHLPKLLKTLDAQNTEALAEQVKHFTEKEAEKRDRIVLDYFGEEGVQRIVNSITNSLLSPPKPAVNAEILDAGAGTGFFTIKIAQKLHRELPNASCHAMDITPAMLQVLAKRTTNILPFLGIAENISISIKLARRHLKIPEKFDAII